MKNWPPATPPGFPLTIGERGYYKRIAGRNRWICGRRSPDQALATYHKKAAALLSGANPLPTTPPPSGVITVRYILARWDHDRENDSIQGKLSATAFTQYHRSANRLAAIIGPRVGAELTADDVRSAHDEIAKRFGADAARRAMSHLRQALRYSRDVCSVSAFALERCEKLSIQPKRRMRWRLFAADQIATILSAVDEKIAKADGRSLASWIQLRAMILLALNGGYGAKELSELPRDVVDLAGGKIDYGRGKTGADHVVPLWPETITALEPAISLRPRDELLFRTREGNPWCVSEVKHIGRQIGKRTTDHVNERFRELTAPLGLRIKGQGFYKLKHTHATTADEAGDPHATFELRGHTIPGASGSYIRVSPERVQQVVEFVRHKLLSPSGHADKPRSGARRSRVSRSSKRR